MEDEGIPYLLRLQHVLIVDLCSGLLGLLQPNSQYLQAINLWDPEVILYLRLDQCPLVRTSNDRDPYLPSGSVYGRLETGRPSTNYYHIGVN